ncbi:SDR family NAD(P)-dependent oxidoreductase [Rhodohalobacter mucosus]|uniref:SDR family oxidoreductase n=1 Tax=Rhodohalobacter mucosus TaxID=2079485 RepID=A0A316TRG2_9BACT|nr:SDR family oxidoreductase [Rhodohalobacter mucosus]PWN07203.1 SDR family oxidoreductase [Rhodohalobacter mucosus]
MKHVLITGSSKGIGLAIARKLLSEKFLVTGTHHQTPFPEDLHRNSAFTGLKVDLNSQDHTQRELKPLFFNSVPDVLINNAGIFSEADFSLQDDEWLTVWDRTMNVNLRSAALLSKWFVNRHFKHGSKGIIINIASRAAYRGDTQEFAAYAASKAGMTAMTKSIARDFSSKGVVAYTIAPGFIETDMARESIKILGEEALTKNSAFDEVTQPEEVAALAAFLCRGEVRHMTGSTFHINGGSYMI